MNTKQQKSTYTKKNIHFPGKKVRTLVANEDTTANILLGELDLPFYRSVLWLIGGANSLDPGLIPQLQQLFSAGIAPAVTSCKAIVVDGGTNSGVMKLMGEAMQDRPSGHTLLGVAPAALVDETGNDDKKAVLDLNHTDLILTAGDQWGDEISLMFDIVQSLIGKTYLGNLPRRLPWQKKDQSQGKINGVVVLIGGGAITKKELFKAVKCNMEVIIIRGSGGTADEVVKATAAGTPPTDASIAEVTEKGRIKYFDIGQPAKNLHQLLLNKLG